MAKRFTQTDIWNEDWFLDMPKEYKLFWFYLKDQCNHAGIWRPNLKLFEAMIETKIKLELALNYFNNNKERIQVLSSGRWFILDFFVFQYGQTFNPLNRVHSSIQDIYNQEGIIMTSIRGLIDLKDGVKDKDKDKDKYKKKIKNYVYNEFYDEQLKISERNSEYEKFIKILFGQNEDNRKLDGVLSIKNQLTFTEFLSCLEYAEKNNTKIGDKLLKIENNKKYYKDVTSLNRTLKNWLTNRFVK